MAYIETSAYKSINIDEAFAIMVDSNYKIILLNFYYRNC